MAQLNRSISYVAVAAAAAVASLDGLAAASRDYRSLSLFLKFFCAAAAKVTFVPFFPCVFRPNDSKNISASFLFLKLKLNRKNIFWSNFSPVFFCRSIFSAVKPKKIGPVSVWFGLMPFGPTPSCLWLDTMLGLLCLWRRSFRDESWTNIDPSLSHNFYPPTPYLLHPLSPKLK